MGDAVNQDQDKHDPSQKFAMEESTTMTIEFLRARLLAERSISRAARQKADELAKRVLELEEQLKVVNLQRKKAEKATNGVLAILANNGIHDLPEAYESTSDQEGALNDSKESDGCIHDEERLELSRQMTSKMDGLSHMELGASFTTDRSLSWESPNDGPLSVERKSRVDQVRRGAPVGGSPGKQHSGKSNRQVKQGEMRSEVIEQKDGPVLLDARENGMVKHLLETQRKETKAGIFNNGNDTDAEMEQALEHQAHLICQYEDEENAQREWEEKFRDNHSSPDSCEVGNQSDISEERDEAKEEYAETVVTISHNQGGKSGLEEVRRCGGAIMKSLTKRSLPPHLENGCSEEQQSNDLLVNKSETDCPEFSFPDQENLEAVSIENKRQEWSENSSFCSQSHGSSEHQSGQKFSSSKASGSVYIGESSGDERRCVETHHGTSNDLGGVLEALQRAKLSLKNGLSRSLPPAQGTPSYRSTGDPLSATSTGESMETPIGYAALFRVPTTLSLEATSTKPRSIGPYHDPGSSMTRNNPNFEVGVSASDRYTNSRNLDAQPEISTRRPQIDPYFDKGIGVPDSSRYMYPSYPELMSRMFSNDRLPGAYAGARLEMPAGDHYSVYDQMRLNMYPRQ